MGQRFEGVYNIYEKKLVLFRPHQKQEEEDIIEINDVNDPILDKSVGERQANELRTELETVLHVYPTFNRKDYLSGSISPVFFGSAINNFGVKELLDCFIDIAPAPLARETEERLVKPEENKFSGFVFKIHANIDPRHRDRIAFLRVCSGQFERNKYYYHVRQEREMKFSKWQCLNQNFPY